jgi:hypothetical protein
VNEVWSIRNGFRVEVYARGLRQRWKFRVRAANGQIVATSEAYVRRVDAMSTAERLFPRVEDRP